MNDVIYLVPRSDLHVASGHVSLVVEIDRCPSVVRESHFNPDPEFFGDSSREKGVLG
jgi:hypothetical protein